MIFCVERSNDFLCGQVVSLSVWGGCVIFCVDNWHDFMCEEVP